MVDPILEAHTEWVETDEGERLKWVCPECDVDIHKEIRHATIRCPECERIMQSANYSVRENIVDPENPDWYLRKIARVKGMSLRRLKEEIEPEEYADPLSW